MAKKPEPSRRIEPRAAKALKAYGNNPRTHSDEQISQVAASIQQWGWTMPILVDEADVVIAGHGRLAAALKLGLENVPVIVARGWSEAQKSAYRIADNQLTLNAGWDKEMLSGELKGLKDWDFDLSLLGFPELELVQFMAGFGTAVTGEDDGVTVGSLADRFGAVPFSVFNAREGWWQARKRGWLALGIQSELGRGENLLAFSETVLEPDPEKRAQRFPAVPGRKKSGPAGVYK